MRGAESLVAVGSHGFVTKVGAGSLIFLGFTAPVGGVEMWLYPNGMTSCRDSGLTPSR